MFGSYFKKAPKPDRFRETIKKPELSFSIEWRDQSIRRLEYLLSVGNEKRQKLIKYIEVLKAQLDETCRRKGIRDEENNKLRGENDRLNKQIAGAVRAFDEVLTQRDEAEHDLDTLRGEADHFRGCWNAALDELDELRGEVERLKKRNDELQRLYRFVTGCDCEDRIEVK